jgi:hypothetical protein
LPEVSLESIQSWLHSRFEPQDFSVEGSMLYLVDNSELKAPNHGLGFHRSKSNAEPGFDEFAPWGNIVKASDENDGWVQVLGDQPSFLPKTWDGSVVLRRLSKEQHAQFRAGHGMNESIAENFHRQFLKLATADIAERLGLSERYVIWEPDMLMLRDFCPLNAKGRINLMQAAEELQNVRQCGEHHDHSFLQLTGLQYQSVFKKGSVSAHHMVVDRKAMAGFLSHIRERSESTNSHWSTAVLEMACPTFEACACGISDAGSYAAWMKQKESSMVAEVTKQEGLVLLPKADICCPFEYGFGAEKKEGLLAAKFPKIEGEACQPAGL